LDEDFSIAISPRHSVRLAMEYRHLIDKAPRRDFSVRTITRREANGTPLMAAEIVIAGEEARTELPLAATYPLHFKKTYYPARLHGDPKVEYDRQLDASRLIAVMPPIGSSHDTFRACMIPGSPLTTLLPFQTEPEDRNLHHARELPLAAAVGLWRLTELVYRDLVALHAGGLAHGDAELHNFVVCPAPLETVVVDFEAAVLEGALDAEGWAKRQQLDLDPLLRLAALLQCSLGTQPGDLGERCRARMPALFRDPDKFRREMDRQSTDLG
jgi:hypothetical protein